MYVCIYVSFSLFTPDRDPDRDRDCVCHNEYTRVVYICIPLCIILLVHVHDGATKPRRFTVQGASIKEGGFVSFRCGGGRD